MLLERFYFYNFSLGLGFSGWSGLGSSLLSVLSVLPERMWMRLSVTLHENSKNKAVLFYDMEQSKVQLYKNIINLLRRCRRESILEWFKAYYLTGMSRKECLLSIIQIWWHLVVIDRIADLIKCANDEAKSTGYQMRNL